jgi:hypothetical protein
MDQSRFVNRPGGSRSLQLQVSVRFGAACRAAQKSETHRNDRNHFPLHEFSLSRSSNETPFNMDAHIFCDSWMRGKPLHTICARRSVSAEEEIAYNHPVKAMHPVC